LNAAPGFTSREVIPPQNDDLKEWVFVNRFDSWLLACTHTSGTSDNLELTRCPRLIKFSVLLSLLAILNQHRRVQFLHPSSLYLSRRCRPHPRRPLVPCLHLNRCQHRPRSEPEQNTGWKPMLLYAVASSLRWLEDSSWQPPRNRPIVRKLNVP
jgi:hypothetical protein